MPKFTFKSPRLESSPHSDRFAMSCESEDARFHIWLGPDLALCQTSRTVYKNPPIGVKRFSKGDFKTRHLDAERHGEGAAAMTYLMTEAPALLPGAIEARAAAERAETVRREASMRNARMEEAAPEAYAVCLELIKGDGSSESLQRAIDKAIEVLAAVDPNPDERISA